MAAKPYHSLKIAGKTYKLKLSTAGIVEFEENWSRGSSIMVMGQMLADGTFSMKDIAELLRAAMQKHHGELEIEDVYDLIDKAGGFQGVIRPLEAALAEAFPTDEAGTSEEGEDNPNESPSPGEDS